MRNKDSQKLKKAQKDKMSGAFIFATLSIVAGIIGEYLVGIHLAVLGILFMEALR